MNISEILAGGARLVRTQPKAIALWGVLYLVVMVGLLLALMPLASGMIAAQQQAIAAQAAGMPPQMPPIGGFFAGIIAFDFVLLAVFCAIFAAAVRAVATGGSDSFGFLRFGGDELRLMGLVLLIFLCGAGLMVVVAIAFGMVVAVIAGISSSAGGTPGAAAFGLIALLYLAFACVAIWVQVRLSLAGAFTVLRGRIVVGEAWHATRGRFWTLFCVYLLLWIGYVVFTLMVTAIMFPGLLTGYLGAMSGDPQATQAMLAQSALAGGFGARTIVGMLIGVIGVTIFAAFGFGAVATAALAADREERDAV